VISHATHGFKPKPHTPNLSPRPKLQRAPWWLQTIHVASFDPCRFHHIVGFSKSLSKPRC